MGESKLRQEQIHSRTKNMVLTCLPIFYYCSVLDGTTLEWTDGIFTSLLRTILGNQRGEADRRHWIVFDGDVDPEWAENLNR